MLTRDQIFGSDDLVKKKLHIPEWGGDIYVRTMKSIERDAFEALFVGSNGKPSDQLKNLRARLAQKTVCDENGKALFTLEDVEKLGQRSAAAMDRIFDLAQELNHVTDADIDKAVKNLEGGQSEDSGTA